MTPESKPRLSPKVRLRYDRYAGCWMLLYPEKGLATNASAADIITRCSGEETVRAIVAQLMQKYEGQPCALVEADVLNFLNSCCDRGLIQVDV